MSNMAMKISVAMTTYNGEKYVIKQLDSIYNQTLTPDEVLICDDGSNDETVSLVNAFIKKNSLNNTWRLIQNNPNLGWQRNFYKAISLTTGDIVFFSDQDDIWSRDKIQIMANYMNRHKIGALLTGRTIIDSEDRVIDSRQEKLNFTNELKKIPLHHNFYELKTLGCCMCVSRELVNLYIKINFPEGGHDSQCGRLAAITDSLWYLDTPLIKYRIHFNNTSGISNKASFGQSNKLSRICEIEESIKWMECLFRVLPLDDNRKNLLSKSLAFQRKRYDYFCGSTSLLYLIRNRIFYRDITMLCGDIAYKYNINKYLGMLRWKMRNVNIKYYLGL